MPFEELRAQVDVPDQSQCRVRSDRGRRHPGQLHEPFLQCPLPVRERPGVSEGSETLLGDVPHEVTDIEGRITLTVEVEVEQEETLAVHDHLVGVEVPVDAARLRLPRRCPQAVGGAEESCDASRPGRPRRRDGGKVRLQDFQFVGHRVALCGRDPCSVDLAGYLRDLPGQRDTATRRQELGRSTAGNFALEPHLELRDGADWLRNRDPIRAVGLKPGIPKRVEKPMAALAVPTDPHLADQHDRLRLSVRPRYVNLVFDHAAAPRLVPSDADRAEVDGAMLPGQPKQVALEVLLNCSRVKRQFERGHRLVTSDSEWIVHRDAHRSASPASLLHRASKRSTWRVSEKRSTTRRRAAAPNRATKSGSRRSRSSAPASLLASPGGVRNPVTPSSISSAMPPTAVATAGTPHAAASMRLTGIPSLSLASTATAARRHHATTLACSAAPTSSTVRSRPRRPPAA